MAKKQTGVWTAGGIIAIVIGVMVSFGWFTSESEAVSFGQCLTEQGVTMYGVDWCPNCRDQKRVLGEEFASVDYVNCDFQKELCREKGVTMYPVWSKGNDALIGFQPLEQLSEFSGCPLP